MVRRELGFGWFLRPSETSTEMTLRARSTIFAARYVRTLVSVESDAVFKRALQKEILFTKADVHLLSPYIGATAERGTPVFAGLPCLALNAGNDIPRSPGRYSAIKFP